MKNKTELIDKLEQIGFRQISSELFVYNCKDVTFTYSKVPNFFKLSHNSDQIGVMDERKRLEDINELKEWISKYETKKTKKQRLEDLEQGFIEVKQMITDMQDKFIAYGGDVCISGGIHINSEQIATEASKKQFQDNCKKNMIEYCGKVEEAKNIKEFNSSNHKPAEALAHLGKGLMDVAHQKEILLGDTVVLSIEEKELKELRPNIEQLQVDKTEMQVKEIIRHECESEPIFILGGIYGNIGFYFRRRHLTKVKKKLHFGCIAQVTDDVNEFPSGAIVLVGYQDGDGLYLCCSDELKQFGWVRDAELKPL